VSEPRLFSSVRADVCSEEKVVISTGVGQHQMWACQYYRWTEPRSWVSSGGLGVSGAVHPA
jgi:acetolactate synthase-1/2/3 large subunit